MRLALPGHYLWKSARNADLPIAEKGPGVAAFIKGPDVEQGDKTGRLFQRPAQCGSEDLGDVGGLLVEKSVACNLR